MTTNEGSDERTFRLRLVRQHNVFRAEEWLSSGLSKGRLRTLIERGEVIRKAPRVLQVTGAPETYETKAMVGIKRAGPRAALYAGSAATLLELMEVREPIHIATTRRVYEMAGYRFHRVALPPAHVTEVNGIPVTDAPRTLLDACAELYHRQAGRLIDRALRRGLCSLDDLAQRCEEEARSGRRGIRVMRVLLAERDPSTARARSDLEIDFFRFLNDYGFALPIRNHLVDSSGGFPWEIDFFWPERRGVELGTFGTHGMDSETYYKDQDKLLDLKSLGYEIVLVSDRMMRDPSRLAAKLRRAGIPQR